MNKANTTNGKEICTIAQKYQRFQFGSEIFSSLNDNILVFVTSFKLLFLLLLLLVVATIYVNVNMLQIKGKRRETLLPRRRKMRF